MKQALFSLMVAAVLFSGCTSGGVRIGGDPIEPLPTRTFFRYIMYSMADHEVARGMRELEDLLLKRFPKGLLDESGEVPEEYIAALYRDASGGDRHITRAEYEQYRDRFITEVEYVLPDPLRPLRSR